MTEAIVRSSKVLAAGAAARVLTFDFSFRAALVALIFVVYAPSLHHAPRADQWCYLGDMLGHHDPLDLIRSSYSYNRTRHASPGDTDLFRPILFAMLALEKGLLEGDLYSTQMIGIVLHCGICLQLLGLLRRIQTVVRSAPPVASTQPEEAVETPDLATPPFMPYAITAFFAFNPAIQDLVIWSHLHGYLIFLVFLLGSVNLLLVHISGRSAGSLRSSSLWGAWMLAFLSAFSYEMGQLYAVLAGLFLAASVYRRVGAAKAIGLISLFAAVLVIYQAANKYDLKVHKGHYRPDNNMKLIRKKLFTHATITNTERYVLYTAVQPFCPSFVWARCDGGRLEVPEALWTEPVLKRSGPLAYFSATLMTVCAGFGLLGLWGLIRRGTSLTFLILLLSIGMYWAYSATNILGRMNLRNEPTILSTSSYYTYTAFLFVLMSLFTLWQGSASGTGRATTAAWNFLMLGLIALAIYGAVQVRSRNSEFAAAMKGISAPIRAIHKFVREHRREPDFSMQIDYVTSDPMGPRGTLYDPDIIFYQWVSADPKYRVAIRHREAVILSVRPHESLVNETQEECP